MIELSSLKEQIPPTFAFVKTLKRLFPLALLWCAGPGVFTANAQAQTWSLEQCVRYAQEHNISIQQNILNERLAELRLKQSKLSQLPSANINGTYGQSFGRSINPTTNQFVDGSYRFFSASGNADVLLFGWFSRRRAIESNRLNAEAAAQDLSQLRDDVSLNVATGYLRALLAKQQILVLEQQIRLSAAQLSQTQKFVSSGRLPELNAAQLESQLASDSAAYISGKADYTSAILDLKALLNFSFETPLEIEAPEIIPEDFAAGISVSPEEVYALAAQRFGTLKSADLKIAASEKSEQSMSAARYPQLSLTAQLGNNWASNFQSVSGYTLGGYAPSGQYFTQGSDGSYSPIYTITGTPILTAVPLGRQLESNFRQLVGLNVNVPLFNGWQNTFNYRQAKINTQSARLAREQAEVTLKQNVYKAHNDARNAWQRYYAARRAADAANRALEFATKRYAIGLTNTVEYLVTQTSRFQAESTLQNALFEYIFRVKVLDYYQGKALKL